MTPQEHSQPRAIDGKWSTMEHSEAAGITLGAAAPGTRPKPIIATATLQEWDGDEAVTVGEAHFDAAPILAAMDSGKRAGLGEEPGDQDEIFEKAMAMGLTPRHEGPYEIDVRQALDHALEEDPGYFEQEHSGEKTLRHPDVPLEAPLSAYELGYRIDEDNRVEALAVLDLSEMMDSSSEENWDTVSTTVVGNDLLRDMFPTPVSITSDNQVVYRIEGDAEAVIECMNDDERDLFEAGMADAAANRKA